ncbi:helix-turn-helix domain-containing protein [Actinophytocola sp. NPDC049390]|uniref:helix-turn-helix domain-containing protein n=1 Tax=Actinophytocola sp. NPDC049390 TaxID=3363894 RepID=UPI003789064A
MDLAWRACVVVVAGHSVVGMGVRHTSAAYRELGGMLRRVREKAGITGDELSRRLGWPPTRVSRMENGRRPSTTTDVIQYAVMCGVQRSEVQPIVDFTRMAESQEGYYLSDKWIDGSLQSLIFHESSAEQSIIYEPQVINGLVQTPGYTRALIAARNPMLDADTMAGVVRTRVERQRILTLPDPGRFTFFVHEHALRLRIGCDQVMHEQLLHLVLTAALDNVSLRIVPSSAGERSAVGGAFRLMEFQEHRPMVYLDNLGGGGLILDDPGYVRRYRELVPMLTDVALDEGQSREFAADLADEYDRGSQGVVADVLAEEQLQRRGWIGLRRSGVEATPIYQ